MDFFEFFFSGPGWGWRAFGLIVFVGAFFDGLASIISAIFEAYIKVVTNVTKNKASQKTSKSPNKDIENTNNVDI
jgi:hypothetical protein